ncbi:hypothetical protein C8J56DRAFT_913241 [Mycena floridula]|nr:hypothetical protein C8J56DRAFT_913241 [Mycena floridula]
MRFSSVFIVLFFSALSISALPVASSPLTLLGRPYKSLNSPLIPEVLIPIVNPEVLDRDVPVGRADRFRAMRRPISGL